MPVSYLHPAIEGTLFCDRTPLSSSDFADLGEFSLASLVGDGERAPKESFRACWEGVEGNELEWWAVRCGRGIEASRKSLRSSFMGIAKGLSCHRRLATF